MIQSLSWLLLWYPHLKGKQQTSDQIALELTISGDLFVLKRMKSVFMDKLKVRRLRV